MEKREQKGHKLLYISAVLLVALSLVIPVFALQSDDDKPQMIKQFLDHNPVYDKKVPQGTTIAELGLPKTLKAEVYKQQSREEEDASNKDQAQTEQTQPASDQPKVIIDNGDDSQTQDKEQQSTQQKEQTKQVDIPVTWVQNDPYHANVPGVYTFVARFEGYEYHGEDPSATVTIEAQSDQQPTSVAPEKKNDKATASLVKTKSKITPYANIRPSLDSNDAYVSKLEIARVTDGTPDFDTSNDPNSDYYKDKVGNDANGSNGIVRSFDNVTYDLNYQSGVYGSTSYESGKVCFEFVLPLTSEQAKWDTKAMGWMDSGFTITTENRTYDFNGDGVAETVSCQVLRGTRTLVKTSSNPTPIPGSGSLQAVVNVLAMANNSKVQPIFTTWMEHNEAGGKLLSDAGMIPTGNTIPSAGHNRIENVSVKPTIVRVSAQPRYNIQLKQGNDSFTAVGDTYDFNTGNDLALDKGKGLQTGTITSYGVTLQLYNHYGRQLKGVEYPQGPITFDLQLSTEFKPSNGTLTPQQQSNVAQDYAPLVLSYDAQRQGGGQQDGRDLGNNTDIAYGAAPSNSGNPVEGQPSSACYNGGEWRALKNINKISVKVSDYQIKYPLFPNTDIGRVPSDNTYFDYRNGVQNIGSFSSGEFFILTPFYNNGVRDNSKKGTYILDDVHAADGNFYTTITDSNLRATSLSGQSLSTVGDNSNQALKTDDSIQSMISFSKPGSFDWNINWSKYNLYYDWLGYDPLGRFYDTPGTWVPNGKDQLAKGAPIALFSGLSNNENGYAKNRMYAADTLAKFDADAITLTGNSLIGTYTTDSGYVGTILYATKPDGKNWISDTEMNNAKIEDLKYYASLSKIPKGEKCVAYLTEYRPKGNDPSNIKKYTDGSKVQSQIEGRVGNSDTITGNVYQCVIGGKVWHAKEYEAAGGHIPSMLGNDPTHPISLPSAWVTNYRDYTKAKYDENGYVGGDTGGLSVGDSLRVIDTQTKVKKQIEQKENGVDKANYRVDANERYADFLVTPGFAMPASDTGRTTNVTVSDILDKGLRYVPGSAYLGGTYKQNSSPGQQGTITGGVQSEPEVSQNADGKTTLTWKLLNANSKESLPQIHYSTLIGTPGDEEHDVHDNQNLADDSRIRSTGDLRDFETTTGNESSVRLHVSKLSSPSLSQTTSKLFYDPNDVVNYRMNVKNSNATEVSNNIVMDTLPMNGDAKGSDFDGDFKIRSMNVNASALSNLSSWKCFYTDDVAVKDTTAKDYNYDDILAGNSIVNGQNVHWTQAAIQGDGTIPSMNGKKATAIVWLGPLASGESLSLSAGYQAPDARGGDVLANELSRGSEAATVKTYYANRSISGLPWLDVNGDGQQNLGEDRITGLKVELLQKNSSGSFIPIVDNSGNEIEVMTSHTEKTIDHQIVRENNTGVDVNWNVKAIANADGSYTFSGMPAGTYGVRFVSGVKPIGNYISTRVHVGDTSTDSDALPTYSDGGDTPSSTNKLTKTEIHDISLPEISTMYTSNYESKYNDSGFRQLNIRPITDADIVSQPASIERQSTGGEVVYTFDVRIPKKSMDGQPITPEYQGLGYSWYVKQDDGSFHAFTPSPGHSTNIEYLNDDDDNNNSKARMTLTIDSVSEADNMNEFYCAIWNATSGAPVNSNTVSLGLVQEPSAYVQFPEKVTLSTDQGTGKITNLDNIKDASGKVVNNGYISLLDVKSQGKYQPKGVFHIYTDPIVRLYYEGNTTTDLRKYYVMHIEKKDGSRVGSDKELMDLHYVTNEKEPFRLKATIDPTKQWGEYEGTMSFTMKYEFP